ncbi:MAG: PaaI family thioesterase, partial [Sphingobacteriales bacterium]
MKSPLNFRELAKSATEYQAEFQRRDHLGNLVGARFISIDRDQIIYHYEVKPEHFNPNGFLHGGALYTVMDSSQGAFVHFILDEKFEIAVTGTATIRYEKPLRSGSVEIK